MADSDTAVISILEAVANAERTTPVDLPPLSEAVDPAALNALLDSDGDGRAPLRVSLNYAGYEITVGRDGDVVASPAGASDAVGPTDGRADGPLVE